MFSLKTYFFLLLIFLFNINAATYYVSMTGNDTTGDGSVGAPYRTINKGLSIVFAGDTLYVTQGNYTNDVKATSVRSGTINSPITIVGQNWPNVGEIRLVNSYYTITGIEFNEGNNVTTYNGFIDVYANTDPFPGPILGIKILTNRFRATPTSTYVDGGRAIYGIRFAANSTKDPAKYVLFSEIRGNEFNNIHYPLISMNGISNIVEGNYFHDLYDSSGSDCDILRFFGASHIFRSNIVCNIVRSNTSEGHHDIFQTFDDNNVTDYCTNMLFEQNVISNCVSQIGNFSMSSSLPGGFNTNFGDITIRNNLFAYVTMALNIGIPNVKLYNNTFIRCTQNTDSPLMFRSSNDGWGDNGVIFNNIFVGCGNPDSQSAKRSYVNYLNTVTNLIADYNFVTGLTNEVVTTHVGREANGINGGNVEFVDTNSWNFSLLSTSPAINKGTNLSSVFTTDLLGNTRGTYWDIGAYEYIAPTTNSVLRPRQPERTSWILNRLYHLIGRNRKPRKQYAKKNRLVRRACAA